MRAIGIEMLNKRGGGPPGCALRLEVIAAAAGVSVVTARDALNIANTIGLVTAGHLRGFYDVRIRSPEWLAALRERIEWSEQLEEAQAPPKSAKHRVREIAENILSTDAARLPRRGNGRVQVAELARQVRIQMAAEGEPPPLGMIDRYIRTHVRQWEEHRPGKIRFSAARDPGKDAGKGDTS
jgi:DNA-binding GntR family transcriptional regulator